MLWWEFCFRTQHRRNNIIIIIIINSFSSSIEMWPNSRQFLLTERCPALWTWTFFSLSFGDYLFSKHIQNSTTKFTGYHDTRWLQKTNFLYIYCSKFSFNQARVGFGFGREILWNAGLKIEEEKTWTLDTGQLRRLGVPYDGWYE